MVYIICSILVFNLHKVDLCGMKENFNGLYLATWQFFVTYVNDLFIHLTNRRCMVLNMRE